MLEVKIFVQGDSGYSEMFFVDPLHFPLQITESTRQILTKHINVFQDEEIHSISIKKGSVTYQISRI